MLKKRLKNVLLVTITSNRGFVEGLMRTLLKAQTL